MDYRLVLENGTPADPPVYYSSDRTGKRTSAIKAKYSLFLTRAEHGFLTRAEHDAIAGVLSSC
jgi:hypothetical protein